MNDYDISIWYYTYSFCHHFDGKVVAFVNDNARDVGASFSKIQNLSSLHCIDITIQLRVKGALNGWFQNYIPVSTG